jgi:SAM-dependent methyltransferase
VDDIIVNVEQAAAWDGDEGSSWARDWQHHDTCIRVYHEAMQAAAAVVDGEVVLDVGCGNGQSTRAAAGATPSGSVLGVDLSSPMLERARALARAEGLANVEYVQADAQVHPFVTGSFDLAMSRFGSMFFADKVAAFANIARALRPGGRLLLVTWQPLARNTQFVALFDALSQGRDLPKPPPGAPGPFGLADPDLAADLLHDAGFVDLGHEPVTGEFCAGTDLDDAFAFLSRTTIAHSLLAGLDGNSRSAGLAALRDTLASHETDRGVVFDSAAWMYTARCP